MSRRTSAARVIIGRLILLLVASTALAVALLKGGFLPVPDRWNPFAPLHVADDPNWLTRMKLARLESDPGQCLATLSKSAVAHSPVPDRFMAEGCRFENSVEVARTSVEFNRPFTATCPLMVAWALFEVHVLRPAARQHLDQQISGVTHVGTYACRNIGRDQHGRRSQHAEANAIDIAGFTLADGTRVTVSANWTGSDERKAKFLRAVRDGACEYFDVVLGPDYNEAHRDHFHFDMGSFRACR